MLTTLTWKGLKVVAKPSLNGCRNHMFWCLNVWAYMMTESTETAALSICCRIHTRKQEPSGWKLNWQRTDIKTDQMFRPQSPVYPPLSVNQQSPQFSMPLPQRCYLSLSLCLIQLLTTEIKDESCCASWWKGNLLVKLLKWCSTL